MPRARPTRARPGIIRARSSSGRVSAVRLTPGSHDATARRLVNLLSTLSFALCAASAALWARSHLTGDRWSRVEQAWTNPAGESLGTEHAVVSAGGRLYVVAFFGHIQSAAARLDAVVPGDLWFLGEVSDGPLGFIDGGGVCGQLTVRAVPWWFPTAAFAGLPALRRLVRWRRAWTLLAGRGAGHCPACGYDLRATPERCPECGAAGPAMR